MQSIKVWDGYIRFYHWAMVLLIGVLYFSADQGEMELHFIAGYSLLGLFLTRIIWGFVGSDTAKLTALLHSPKAVVNSFKKISSYTGHNPAGSYMVLLFFTLLFVQLLSGLMTTDEILTDGPLVEYVATFWIELSGEIHRFNFDLLTIAMSVHILAILIYRIKGKNLVKAMLTGFSSDPHLNKSTFKTGWWAFLVFVIMMSVLFTSWGLAPLKVLFNW